MITKSDLSVDQHLFAAAPEPTRVPLADVIALLTLMREEFAAPTRET